MTSATSNIGQFLDEATATQRGTGQSGRWMRGLAVVSVMTVLVLGMNPDGGRHIRATQLEGTAKLVLALGLGMVTAGRFMTRSTARTALA